MSIGDKERLLNSILTVGPENGAFGRLLDTITPAIVEIDGYTDSPRVVLEQLTELADLQEVIRAIIAHCQLTPSESKNLLSSSVQRTPESVGNAENHAGADGEPVSITPTQKDS
jgi:hypothetical protein